MGKEKKEKKKEEEEEIKQVMADREVSGNVGRRKKKTKEVAVKEG